MRRPVHRYPRVNRLNQVVREVVADEIERMPEVEGHLLTVTGVTVEPDLRHATVWFSSLSDDARRLMEEVRPALQAALARQTTMKRTPRLSFQVDPGVTHGQAVEEALRRLDLAPVTHPEVQDGADAGA